MVFLFAGLAILCGLLLLLYLFVNANPARLAGAVKWTGIGLGILVALALVVLSEGRVMALVLPLFPLIPAFRRMRARWSGTRGPAPGRSSEVETPFLRMRLDHDTGDMAGTILRGRFAGMRLAELGRAELIAVLRECRMEDEEGARLIEAYLDRTDPGWHDDWYGEQPGSTDAASVSDISIEEAYAILGLEPGADEAAIRAAHRRLMKQLHPDRGGTDYLATKINRARDVLLQRASG